MTAQSLRMKGTLLATAVLLILVPMMAYAQGPATDGGPVRTAVTSPGENEIGQLRIIVGRSQLVNVGQSITRVSLTRPEIADAMVTTQQQILVHGKAPGTISMFVWDKAGGIKRYDVYVTRDLGPLGEQMKLLFPGENISVTDTGKNIVLAGTVSSKYVMEKAADVASGYVEKKDDVVNMLRLQEGIASNQVLLRVRFAEVTRSALTELGMSLFSDGYKNNLGRTTTEQFAAPFFDQQKPMVGDHLVFSDYLNLFLFNSKNGIGATIHALQTRGLLQSLAEPNLIAENGKEASFLAGGEYPYPVAQGAGSNLAVTIVFKEYGVRLNFVPTILAGGLIHLKVRPEVSSLDFTNAITYEGFRIPSLSTRRAETEIELMDGQTFAIAGLLSNSVTSTMQKIPGIGDIPILGLLFRSKAAQKAQSELVVMITPQILRPGSMGAATGLPNLTEPYMQPPKKTVPQPEPRLPGPGGAVNDVPQPASGVMPASGVAAPPAQPTAPAPVSAPAADAVQPPPADAAQAAGAADTPTLTPAQQKKQDEINRKRNKKVQEAINQLSSAQLAYERAVATSNQNEIKKAGEKVESARKAYIAAVDDKER